MVWAHKNSPLTTYTQLSSAVERSIPKLLAKGIKEEVICSCLSSYIPYLVCTSWLWDYGFGTIQTTRNLTKPTKFHNEKISLCWQNSMISIKIYNFDQISRFQPNFKISTKFHDFDQISRFLPNFTISIKFHIFDQIS